MKTFSVEEVIEDIEETFGVKVQIDNKVVDHEIQFMELFSKSEVGIEAIASKTQRGLHNGIKRFFDEMRYPNTFELPSVEDTFSIYIKAMGQVVYELVATSNTSNALIDKLKEIKKEYVGSEICVLNPHTKTSVFVKN